ncbi:MAG: diguanylate cyclase, partial [Gemmatimonadaceae bacterium]
FLHLLMGISDDKDAIVIAKKILKAIRVPCAIGEFQLHITASIGIALFPRDGITTEALLKSADTAMYIAKRNRAGYSFAPLRITAP